MIVGCKLRCGQRIVQINLRCIPAAFRRVRRSVSGALFHKYSNEEAVIQAVTDAGFDPYEKKLLGITVMQKRLGKSRFDELLTAYIEKPQGKPTLVPESDKRPAMNNAKTDFMEEN